MLDWLMQEDVMRAVGFYAGGAATAIGGLWVAFTKLRGGKEGDAPKTTKPSTQTTNQATNGIAGGRDVSIQGNVSFSQTPLAAWVVFGVGIACLGLVAVFGGDDTTVTNGAVVDGGMKDSSIKIGQ